MTDSALAWSCPRCKRRVPKQIGVCRCGEPRPVEEPAAPATARPSKNYYRDPYVRAAIMLVLALMGVVKIIRMLAS